MRVIRDVALVVTVVVGMVAWAAGGQVEAEAERVLEEAADVFAAIESMSYDVEYTQVGEGVLSLANRRISGSVIAAKTETGWVRRIEGTEDAAEFLGTPEQPVLMVMQDLRGTWIRPREKEMVRAFGIAPMRKSPSEANFLAPKDLFAPEPLAKSRRAERLSLESPEEFGGAVCDVVSVQASARDPGRLFFFDRGSRLLCGWRQVISGGEQLDGAVTTTVTLTNVRTDIPVDPSVFDLEPPVGYSVVERGQAPKDENGGGPTRPTLTTSRVVGVEVGNVAPAFSVPGVDGEPITLESLSGSPAIIYFFSSWNPQCQRMNTELGELLDGLGDDRPAVAAMAVRERDPAAPTRVAEQYGFRLSVGSRRVASGFQVRTVPAVFVIDGEGRIVHTESGHTPGETVGRIAEALTAAARNE